MSSKTPINRARQHDTPTPRPRSRSVGLPCLPWTPPRPPRTPSQERHGATAHAPPCATTNSQQELAESIAQIAVVAVSTQAVSATHDEMVASLTNLVTEALRRYAAAVHTDESELGGHWPTGDYEPGGSLHRLQRLWSRQERERLQTRHERECVELVERQAAERAEMAERHEARILQYLCDSHCCDRVSEFE